MPTIERNEPTVQEKIYNLLIELTQAKKDKKDLVKAHNENIKRIEAEIKELIEEEQDKTAEAQED